MTQAPAIFGILAGFETHAQLRAAAERARAQGYRSLDAYSPFPVEGLTEALGRPVRSIPLIMLCAGVAGGLAGYALEWFALAVDYPLKVGGKPLHSWPMFIPIAFELTVLSAALAGFISVLVLNRLPQLYHPVFNVAEFARASRDRFFLCIEASDPQFERHATRRFLETLEPYFIAEVAT